MTPFLSLLIMAAYFNISPSTGFSPRITDEPIHTNYLKKYGYLTKVNPMHAVKQSERNIREAVVKFQISANIPSTGEINDRTAAMMNSPRCGVVDTNRHKRYTLQGSRWNKFNLTYRIENYPTPGQMTKADVHADIKAAFGRWSAVSVLTFEEIKTPQVKVDIQILFAKRAHGHISQFDGKGGTLAHAMFPHYGGDIHFDQDETWTRDMTQGTNLLAVAIHEIGHSLGLDHTYHPHSVMYAFYRGATAWQTLRSDDIAGIVSIYGDSQTGSITPKPTTLICDKPYIDAATTTKSGDTYFFKDNKYYQIINGSNGLATTYPKPLSDGWNNILGPLEAVWTDTALTHVFKETKYWIFRGKGRVTNIHGFNRYQYFGSFTKFDATFRWTLNGTTKMYITSGNKYYIHNTFAPPRIIDWNGAPNSIDAGLEYNGRTYIFKGNDYYKLSATHEQVETGYPQSMSTDWLGCP